MYIYDKKPVTIIQEQCQVEYVTLSFVVLIKVEDTKKQNGGQVVNKMMQLAVLNIRWIFFVKHKFIYVSWYILCFQYNWLKH